MVKMGLLRTHLPKSDVYELALADVTVPRAAVSISESNIKDQRLSQSLCGLVNSLVSAVAEVSRSFIVAPSPFEEIAVNETTAQAVYIQSLRTAVNNVRRYYGMVTVTWAEEVVAGRTPIRNWTFHVLELREAIEQGIELVNGFSPGSTLGIAVPDWLPFTHGKPKAAVIWQLQDILLDL